MSSNNQRIVVIGATGTIGNAVADALEARGHEVLRASRKGELSVDIDDPASIEALLERVGHVDAIVSAAGGAEFGSVQSASDGAYELSMRSKLMGQVNLIRQAASKLAPEASVTITSGILGQYPGPGTAPVAMVNAGLEGYVRAAAKDLPKGPRVNVVAPPFIRETAVKMGMANTGMPAAVAANAYVEAVEGGMSGETLFATA